jgi:hypothetical protein
MVSRREVVLGGMAVATFPVFAGVVGAPSPAREASGRHAIALYKVVYDEHFPASVEFGRKALARGFAVHAIRGDMTDLWYYDLYPKWKTEPAAIAGLTAHGPLFCLERLSWDFGMRVSLREQRPGGLYAWVIAPRRRA